LGKAEDRIQKRRNTIKDYLKKRECYDIEHGLTVAEIAKALGESESTIRIDLGSMNEDGIMQDKKRSPRVFWLSRREVNEIKE
jgi:DeoR/GlpR family transcriptional regulator of sugar metabolism